jgi:hypothetical protein
LRRQTLVHCRNHAAQCPLELASCGKRARLVFFLLFFWGVLVVFLLKKARISLWQARPIFDCCSAWISILQHSPYDPRNAGLRPTLAALQGLEPCTLGKTGSHVQERATHGLSVCLSVCLSVQCSHALDQVQASCCVRQPGCSCPIWHAKWDCWSLPQGPEPLAAAGLPHRDFDVVMANILQGPLLELRPRLAAYARFVAGRQIDRRMGRQMCRWMDRQWRMAPSVT